MTEEKSLNFIEEIIEDDLKNGKYNSIVTRFPPEPNGYLHIGHATSICLNFGVANKYGGYTNLRFDDTNPVTEETEYVESIKQDVQWLGFEWKNELYASDYFEQFFQFAIKLIQKGLAYVDDSTSEEIAAMKGTPTEAGKDSPFRSRTIDENLQLFQEMRDGKFADGSKVLRAKIDMASPNMIMRDPILYRIKHAHHHRTGDQWCIYPMYDMAHPPSDSIEQVTHSLCTLEFVPHRELYDWLLSNLDIFPSHQYEFARRNLSFTVMSKRKLLQLVQEKHVEGWDDPRMPTISGMRRRGYTAEAIKDFCDRIGVAKRDNLIDVGLLEFCVREHLNKIALRRMVVFDPLKVIITNYPENGPVEMLEGEDNPEDENTGKREIPFGRELYIEREDFIENPPKKYFRLFPGGMVRLKHAYIIRCDEAIKDEKGNIEALHCTYIAESRSGNDTSGINVKGTLHWVEVTNAINAEVRLYDRLFKVEDPSNEDGDFKDYINENSLEAVSSVYAEPALMHAAIHERYQFLRKGYFTLD
ncbi:MAG TPA: glutamine--tRNA ligase/YqeY domain fusion protein, partial [Flavisolibacter sp.]|nr:glutamine--tRNA ligase/YqeY domain fusion protein [Flavisolibacter sp.]